MTALLKFEWRRAAIVANIEGEARGEGRFQPSATRLTRERQTMKITDVKTFRYDGAFRDLVFVKVARHGAPRA